MKYEHKYFPCRDERHLSHLDSDLFRCACARRDDRTLCDALTQTTFKDAKGKIRPCPFFKTVLRSANEGNIPPIE